MKKLFLVLCVLAIVFGCLSQTPQSYKHTAPRGKYDGQYRNEDLNFTMTMDIKSNVIKGYFRLNRWPGEIRMQINGMVIDDKFQIDYIHHPDVRVGFEMEVTAVDTNRINGWLYNDSNNRYSWSMTKVNEIVDPNAKTQPVNNKITQPVKSDDDIESKLLKLKSLRDQGLITQEDYDKKKSELLDSY